MSLQHFYSVAVMNSKLRTIVATRCPWTNHNFLYFVGLQQSKMFLVSLVIRMKDKS